MRSIAVLLALLVVSATSGVVSAQVGGPFGQLQLTPDAGSRKGPLIFRGVATPLSKLDLAAPPIVVATTPAPPASQAIDCAMVKPVDPKFHSNMPVAKPNPNIAHTMRGVPAPSCREQTETRGASGR
jgi:hypothetical protein